VTAIARRLATRHEATAYEYAQGFYVFWGGEVIDQEVDDDDVGAVRELNDIIRDDPRVDVAMVPIADGLTLARKK
jgi:hypothetical protein